MIDSTLRSRRAAGLNVLRPYPQQSGWSSFGKTPRYLEQGRYSAGCAYDVDVDAALVELDPRRV